MLSGTTDVPPSGVGETSFDAQPSFATRTLPRASIQIETAYHGNELSQPSSRVAPSPQAQQPNAFTAPRPLLLPLQEYHSGYSDEGDGAAPSHRRQQSYPNLLATLRNRTPSPTRRSPRLPDQMPLTGDRRAGTNESPKSGFAGWLSGTSSALGMTSSPDGTPNSQGARAGGRDMTPDTTPTGPPGRRKTVTTSSDNSAKSAVSTTASRFMSAISRFAQAPVSPTVDDELCNIHIESALFPPGSPTSNEPFSPAAYKNLHTNAVGLLTKMQTAYREKVRAVREMEAERSVQKDEIEEAETRNQHLKMQLEGMAKRAQEQERHMKQLMEELAAERKARAEERYIREKGIAIMPEGSVISEDLGVDEDHARRKWRKSADTVKSDGSFDTDEESAESESVFSRSRSPTLPPNTFEGSSIDVSAAQPKARSRVPPRSRPEQMSALQKIFKGIAGDTEDVGPDSCRNCKGRDASVAWDTVSLLRDENRHLKQRVGELEIAVEGALDLVNGIGL